MDSIFIPIAIWGCDPFMTISHHTLWQWRSNDLNAEKLGSFALHYTTQKLLWSQRHGSPHWLFALFWMWKWDQVALWVLKFSDSNFCCINITIISLMEIPSFVRIWQVEYKIRWVVLKRPHSDLTVKPRLNDISQVAMQNHSSVFPRENYQAKAWPWDKMQTLLTKRAGVDVCCCRGLGRGEKWTEMVQDTVHNGVSCMHRGLATKKFKENKEVWSAL